MPLATEAAAHVGRDDAHALFRQTQGGGDGRWHRVGQLCRAPHGEAAIVRRGTGQDTAGLQGHRRDSRKVSRPSTTTRASANPVSAEPTSPLEAAAMLSGHWGNTRGASGPSAASTSAAAGRGSYSTRTASAASAAR